ncbi:hypothetical protein DFS34DRAFT_494413 [Phlyctochytrium arcticum]|nr:hypothetical protein DFS34DRAFT_494413 [Phlyctochytrium arcticum]
MSWKGFQKAVVRLPTRLAQRTGYSSESVDPEYRELETQFKHCDALATRLTAEAKKLKDSLSAMLAHQAKFANTLLEVYAPISGKASGLTPVDGVPAPGGATAEGEEDPYAQMHAPIKVRADGKHANSIAAAQVFADATARAREQLLPDLDVIERQVVAPTNDFIVLIQNVKRLMDKRARKLVDYDRNRENVKKLTDKQDRTLSDEKKLGSLETSLDQSTREFNHVDLLLKQELPIFLGYKVAFIDPCFQTLYWYELKVVQVLHDCFSELSQNGHFNMHISAMDGFNQHAEAQLEMLAGLTLVKRPYKRGDGSPITTDQDTGYGGSPDVSPEVAGIPPSSSAAASSFKYQQQQSQYPSSSSSDPPLPPYEAQPKDSPNPFGASSSSSKPALQYPNPFGGATSSIKPPPPPSTTTVYVVALYDFQGQEEGDLSFTKDDKIEVLERTDNVNDWWKGRVGGRVGTFPGNYVSDI